MYVDERFYIYSKMTLDKQVKNGPAETCLIEHPSTETAFCPCQFSRDTPFDIVNFIFIAFSRIVPWSIASLLQIRTT
jgi:hypothetical protein